MQQGLWLILEYGYGFFQQLWIQASLQQIGGGGLRVKVLGVESLGIDSGPILTPSHHLQVVSVLIICSWLQQQSTKKFPYLYLGQNTLEAMPQAYQLLCAFGWEGL